MVRQRAGITEPSIAVLSRMRGKVYGFGQIRSVKQHRTKQGEMMAFVKIADETGEIDTAVMPRLYRSAAPVLLRGTYIRFNGKISQEGSMILDEIRVIPKK